MTVPVRVQELADRMKRKRQMERLTFREAAKACHVSLGTFYRAERDAKGVPDLATLLGICGWLGIPIEEVLDNQPVSSQRAGHVENQSTPEIVEAHLRADKKLAPETAKALAEVFRAAYERFAAKEDLGS